MRGGPLPLLSDVSAGAEFKLDDQAFQQIRALIEQRAGIQLSETKRSMVYNRLARRLRETGAPSFTDYLADLQRPGSAEWQPFINALTTNLTAFFREEYHFPVLADFLRTAGAGRRTINIWCAAASTGQEPYSIAMTAIEALGPRPSVRILASDIDTEVLATARDGVYAEETVNRLSTDRLHSFFLRGRAQRSGLVRVRPEVRALVTFQQFNLIEPGWSLNETFDVVFCRNVMIYFDRETRTRLIENFHRVMSPGGLLFVGHSESFSESRTLFTLQGRTVYQRVGG
ncbi:MAG TPA: CheR family methyltransferase [Burkholderiaceae bacterium]|nr:CheR family methyltransferase [Burkholderiaceae bacterium]